MERPKRGLGFVFPGVIPKRPLSSTALAMLLRRMDVDATAFELADACAERREVGTVSAVEAEIRPAFRNPAAA